MQSKNIRITMENYLSFVVRALYRGFLIIVSLLSVIILLPLILPISISFRLYQRVITKIIEYGSDGKDKVISGMDAILLQDSAENHLVVHSLLVFEEKLKIKDVQQAVDVRIVNRRNLDGSLKYPIFKMYPKIVYGRYVWTPDEYYNIEGHVFQYDKNSPKNEEEFKDVLSQILSTPIPEKKSGWQFILVPLLYKGIQKSALLLRCHHSMADGISLMRVFENCFVDKKPHEAVLKTFGSQGQWKRTGLALITGPFLLIERVFWAADKFMLHGPSLSGNKRVAWSKAIDLTLVKKVKNATGTTVNDVLVSCLGGALTCYCNEYGDENETPDNILTFIPVDLRPKAEPVRMGNHFGCVFLKIPAKLCDNALERLYLIRHRMAAIKASAEPLVTEIMMNYGMNCFPDLITTRLFDLLASKYTTVLSNLPGPQHRLTFLGKTIEQFTYWPPQTANVGLGISILSYAGQVRVGVTSDVTVMKDPSFICEEFGHQFHQLAKLLSID